MMEPISTKITMRRMVIPSATPVVGKPVCDDVTVAILTLPSTSKKKENSV